MLEGQIPAAELRQLYVQANLRQRYSVACDWLGHPSLGPLQVVAAVAALEGFSRAVAVKNSVDGGANLESAYLALKWKTPVELVEKYVLPAFDLEVTALDHNDWQLLQAAIDYRNLLVHEATYLNGASCQELRDAVVRVLGHIARVVGIAQ